MSTTNTHPELNRLLSSNAQWAADVGRHEPDFFAQSARGQAPKVLWFGCADSRVPESVIMACKPGEIFVHRNIANQFHLHDDSAQSVLTYAVENLGVEHVVVVGHTQCGGVAGAYDMACSAAAAGKPAQEGTTPLLRWLTPLVGLASAPELTSASDRSAALVALVEANVRAQVANILTSDVIQRAWAASADTGVDQDSTKTKKKVYVHGWVYELESGRLRDLGVSAGPEGRVGDKFVQGVNAGRGLGAGQ